MKIGVCTGGGDCPGLNAVIRAVVKHAIGTFGHEVYGIKDSFDGLMNRPIDVRQLHLADVTDILTRGGTILGTTNKGNPFKLERSDGTTDDKSQAVLDAYRQLGLEAIIVIGGDGTQTIAYQLMQLGVNVVGVPKTIDNDLLVTEQTVGFDTAVEVAADAVSRLRSTAESHDRIMVLEVMGRDAGYIALHAGIAGGANIVLIPEIPFQYEPIVEKIRSRRQLGRNFSVIVVSEGAFEQGSSPLGYTSTTDSSSAMHLGGIGAHVAQELFNRTGFDTRETVLGHVQRGGMPSVFDRILATAFGVHAVDLVHQKRFGQVVALRDGKISEVAYQSVAGRARPLSLDDFYIHAAEAIGVCLGR